MKLKDIVRKVIFFFGVCFVLVAVVLIILAVLREDNRSMEEKLVDLTAVTGSLVFNRLVNDPDYDLGKSYPLLWRKVEMAQYVQNHKRKKRVRIELRDDRWFESSVPASNDLFSKTYTNPPFPTWISTEFGDVRIKNDEQMYRLDKTLVEKLTYNGYDHFDQNPETFVVARKLVQGGEEGWKNRSLIDYDPQKHKLKAGDVVVTWYAIKPESLAQTYTVVGYVHGDVIGDKNSFGNGRGDAFISDNDHEYLRRKYNKSGDFNLGLRYYKGLGVPQDLKKAVECFQKAAELGDAKAQNQLGIMYAKGEGVPQDMKKAAEWFQKAAEQGHAKALFNLAVSYDNGDGVPQDKQKAVEWYRKAAEQGHATAQFNLGLRYYNGEEVRQDKKKAVEWWQKAAEQGVANAQFNLGVMHEKGESVEQNKATAKEWYGKACAKGFEKACKALKRIEQ